MPLTRVLALQELQNSVPANNSIRATATAVVFGACFCGSVFAGSVVLSLLSGTVMLGSLVSSPTPSVLARSPANALPGLVIEPELLGAGSVATVHRGYWRGEKVAIKVEISFFGNSI